jgi:S-adenosylmethionine:tRNA-ribosyltransferase-isomerase (queuine synthetase)
MRVELFDFDLPAELIATHPAVPRDAARRREVTRDRLVDRHIGDLPELLRAGDLLVKLALALLLLAPFRLLMNSIVPAQVLRA